MQEHNYNLGFISDRDIYEHVSNTVKSYCRKIDLKSFNDNIVDPIKLTFDSKIYGKTIQQAIADECFRQIDKSMVTKSDTFIKTYSSMLVMVGMYPKKGLT